MQMILNCLTTLFHYAYRVAKYCTNINGKTKYNSGLILNEKNMYIDTCSKQDCLLSDRLRKRTLFKKLLYFSDK